MSLISNKCYYALKAVLDLAENQGNGPIRIADIASRRDIPARFLEAILRELKEQGVTTSIRGKDGGYQLAKLPADISVGDVIKIFRHNLISLSTNGTGNQCVFKSLTEKAEQAVSSVFNETTFQQLVDKERAFIPDYLI